MAFPVWQEKPTLQIRRQQHDPTSSIVEDMSCNFGYQGQGLVNTPHVDRLAKEDAMFNNAYVTAPVCSASRSALITGMYQTATGAHNHRNGRKTIKYTLPAQIKLIPELFQKAGYYTCTQ